MNLEKALLEYKKFMEKKGSSKITISKYHNQIKKIFVFNGKTGENRNTISEKEIDKYFRSQKKRTHNTKCTEIAQLKSFLKFCNIQGFCNLDSRKIFCPKKEQIEANYLTSEQIKKILEKTQTTDIKTRTGILFLLTTGTRISEACNLTKKQLKKAILINKNYQINVKGKGKKIRSIFIPIKIFNLCKKNAVLHGEQNIIGLTSQQLQRNIRKIKKTLNFKFTAHTFRHTYITELGRNGASIYKIQKLAGHSNINTTAHYLHANNEELSKTAELANFGI